MIICVMSYKCATQSTIICVTVACYIMYLLLAKLYYYYQLLLRLSRLIRGHTLSRTSGIRGSAHYNNPYFSNYFLSTATKTAALAGTVIFIIPAADDEYAFNVL